MCASNVNVSMDAFRIPRLSTHAALGQMVGLPAIEGLNHVSDFKTRCVQGL